jgi:NAD(P)-dependent dehydrogenase (short-subunit alcohol dehydrogenase family)
MAEHWLISGASRGIGRELALKIAARGDRVTATVRNEESRLRLAEETREHRDRVEILVLDMRDESAIKAAAHRLKGPIDVVVANAGVVGPKRQSALDTDFDGVLDTFSVNALGPLRLAQAFLPLLRGAANPRIIFISSFLGSLANAGADQIAYRASKTALNMIMRALANELKPQGVTVVSLHPGWLRTDMGGANAPLSVEQGVAGLITTIDALSPSDTGRFLDYRKKEVAW